MSEQLATQEQGVQDSQLEVSGVKFAQGFDPFSDNYTPPAQQQEVIDNGEVNKVAEKVENDKVEESQTQKTSQVQEDKFDTNKFIKEKFGYDSVEVAEQEFKKLKEQKPEPFKFENETSEKLFNAVKEGKIEDVYSILSKKMSIEKLVSSEITTSTAADIIKLSIQEKNKDLTSDEVEFLFSDKYNIPAKPIQELSDTDEDYAQKVSNWESSVSAIQKRMVIEAKLAKPELEKLNSELKFPDIQMPSNQAQPSQEDLDSWAKARESFEKTLESDYTQFNGYNVTVKDEEVEIPISYNVNNDEKVVMKNDLLNFDSNAYFEGRWFTKEGKPNVTQMMEDKHTLENLPKILQKVANEAASQMKLFMIKKSGNITVDSKPTPQGTINPATQSTQDALAEWAFSS